MLFALAFLAVLTVFHTQEMVVLASVRHPCIVNMLGGSLRPPHVFIVEELCAQSLDARLHRPGAGPLTNREMLKYAVDVAQGLQYLHERSPPIVHRGGTGPGCATPSKTLCLLVG